MKSGVVVVNHDSRLGWPRDGSTSSWSGLSLALTVVVALSFLVLGITRPALNFDLIPYAALAKDMRGAGGKEQVYRELEAKIGQAHFASYVSSAYDGKMYGDAAFFAANLPFYKIRPFYIVLCSAIGWLLGNDVVATYVVSAIAAAASVLVSYAIARQIGLSAGRWRLAVPLSWGIAGGLSVATLSTPDAVVTLLGLLFIVIWLAERRMVARALGLILLAGAIVATRTDALLFVLPLLIGDFWCYPRHRAAALSAMIAALATYVVVQIDAGNYGYIAVLNLTLIDGPQRLLIPNLVPNLSGYLRALTRGILEIIGGSDGEGGIFLFVAGILSLASLRGWHLLKSPHENDLDRRIFLLSGGLIFFLAAHFMLFPVPWARYMVGPYVLAGLILARLAQQSFTSRPRLSLPVL